MLKDIADHAYAENHQPRAGDAAEGAYTRVQPTGRLPPPPPPLIEKLREWHRRRVHAIGMQAKCDRSCDGYIAGRLGDGAHLSKPERKALFARAAKMREGVEKQIRADEKRLLRAMQQKPKKNRGQGHLGNHKVGAPVTAGGEGLVGYDDHEAFALSVCLPIIHANFVSRRLWDKMRDEAETEMRAIARSFPVWLRCQQVMGFKDLGLAVLVAEAGNDLSAYPHWYMLWKRLGLAPYKGRAMSSYGKGPNKPHLTNEEWIEAGYSPKRRGRIAGDIGVPLFMAKAHNDYGAVYRARRERTAATHPEWSDGHSDNDARRIMLKALVRDVWKWWAMGALMTVSDMRTSASGTGRAGLSVNTAPAVPAPLPEAA